MVVATATFGGRRVPSASTSDVHLRRSARPPSRAMAFSRRSTRFFSGGWWTLLFRSPPSSYSDGRDRINHSFESVPVQNYAKCMMCCH
ncbi:hypothetical protein M6B38_276265 [Iris pallida]|uniref:Uncharacterized protein n=1 Tax=Iris pallida TaxID=29817 RepID=A0AAX6I491_IRIPA|nr:hypothetical protein M6B38_276265 [Iris pallida]